MGHLKIIVITDLNIVTTSARRPELAELLRDRAGRVTGGAQVGQNRAASKHMISQLKCFKIDD